ncbi:hypothetical protein B0H19DRAFT_1261829 [Mycena capillaripes]|nr:hypothetical protein B0H19DRAFT_1261829 [Mycena capillaripes]
MSVLPRLHTLDILVTEYVHVGNLLDYIVVPALRRLVIAAPRHGMRLLSTMVPALLSRSLCTIESLEIKGPKIPDGTLIALLVAMPTLIKLDLRSPVSALLIQHLTRVPTSPRYYLCPGLKVLRLFDVMDGAESAAMAMIESRSRLAPLEGELPHVYLGLKTPSWWENLAAVETCRKQGMNIIIESPISH